MTDNRLIKSMLCLKCKEARDCPIIEVKQHKTKTDRIVWMTKGKCPVCDCNTNKWINEQEAKELMVLLKDSKKNDKPKKDKTKKDEKSKKDDKVKKEKKK